MTLAGTWLGITRSGRFAGLTNIREKSSIAAVGTASRGAFVSSFLASPDSNYQSWMGSGVGFSKTNLDIDQVGGFSMLYGQLSRDDQKRVRIDSFGVISNRNQEEELHERKLDFLDKTKSETYGLSNSTFTKPWPKVLNGKRLLGELVDDIQHDRLSDRDIINKGIEILSSDSVSTQETWLDGSKRLDLLQQSIFIPLFESSNLTRSEEGKVTTNQHQDQGLSGPYNLYGTQKQTVIVVHESGTVRYVEKTLFDWLQGARGDATDIAEIVFDLNL